MNELDLTIPVIIGGTFAFLTLVMIRSRRKIGLVQATFQATVYGLMSLGWFYLCLYFLLFPENFPVTPRERDLLSGTTLPLITMLPLIFVLVISLIIQILSKNELGQD